MPGLFQTPHLFPACMGIFTIKSIVHLVPLSPVFCLWHFRLNCWGESLFSPGSSAPSTLWVLSSDIKRVYTYVYLQRVQGLASVWWIHGVNVIISLPSRNPHASDWEFFYKNKQTKNPKIKTKKSLRSYLANRRGRSWPEACLPPPLLAILPLRP